MSSGLNLAKSQAWLAVVWIGLSIVISILLGVQASNGRFGDDEGTAAAWTWLTPWLSPGVSVVLGGLLTNTTVFGEGRPREVRPALFWSAIVCSAVFLLAVLGVLIASSFADESVHAFFRRTGIGLAVGQSVTLFLVTAFFVAPRISVNGADPVGFSPNAVAAE